MANKDKFNKACDESKSTLKALIKQMEATHPPLKDLLKEEIEAYFATLNAFSKCINTLFSFSKEWCNYTSNDKLMAEKLIKDAEIAKFSDSLPEQITVVKRIEQFQQMIEQTKTIHEKVISLCDEYSEIFMDVIDRDYRNWGKLAGDLGKLAAKFSIGMFPLLSEVSNILGTTIEIADIVEEYSHSVSDYAETDKQLQIIDKHTKLLKATTDFFEWSEKQIPSWSSPQKQ